MAAVCCYLLVDGQAELLQVEVVATQLGDASDAVRTRELEGFLRPHAYRHD